MHNYSDTCTCVYMCVHACVHIMWKTLVCIAQYLCFVGICNSCKPEWKAVEDPSDNLDIMVRVRDMRMDNQNKSIHIFHAIAVQDRIDSTHLDNSSSGCSVDNLSVTDFLPSKADYDKLRDCLVILTARVVVDGLDAFKMFKSVVPVHISHPHSREMQTQGVVVRLIHT